MDSTNRLGAGHIVYLTLRECSYDSDNREYLVDCEDPAICCDEVVKRYNAQVGGIREPPKSVDAVFVGDDGRCTFIEFKNKALDKSLSYETRRKAYDTLLILGDMQGVRIGETRSDSDLVLVYSGAKTHKKGRTNEAGRVEVSRSESFSNFAKTIAKMAKTHFIDAGMGVLKRYCFHDVFVCTEDEFQKEIMKDRISLLRDRPHE